MAVAAITAEARHARKGNAKMLSLIEKMKKRVPAKAEVADDCPGMMCPGDWCCTDADLTCCEEESPYVCAQDPDVCDECPGQMCDGDWCCPVDDFICCDEDSPYICAQDSDICDEDAKRTNNGRAKMNPLLMKMRPKAPAKVAKVGDDCPQMCPGDFCCYEDTWACCEEDSPWICAPDADGCYEDAKRAKMNPLLMKMRPKAPAKVAKVGDDCPQMCPGDFCCYEDTWACCEEDSPWICAPDADGCYEDAKRAKMNPLLMKMRKQPGAKAPAKVGDDCDGQMCPGDWCCTEDTWTCCDEDSIYICAEDPDICDEDAKRTKMNPLLMKMRKQHSAKAPKKVEDDCDGQICPGDWCCPDDTLQCCDEDSPWICVVDADDC